MKIGYARVSMDTQDTNGQVKELNKVCDKVFPEVASGGRWNRPVLQEILENIKSGDVLVVYKLDRLSRSLPDLLRIIKRLEEREARFESLTEHIDTISPGGRMMAQMLGVFAEFEREMIRERTKLGLARARLEGRKGGRPSALSPKQVKEALRMLDEGKSQSEIAQIFGVHRVIIHRLAKEQRVLVKLEPGGGGRQLAMKEATLKELNKFDPLLSSCVRVSRRRSAR
jgi:DNA invertase Pin-like site-specific DNA recombinase